MLGGEAEGGVGAQVRKEGEARRRVVSEARRGGEFEPKQGGEAEGSIREWQWA